MLGSAHINVVAKGVALDHKRRDGVSAHPLLATHIFYHILEVREILDSVPGAVNIYRDSGPSAQICFAHSIEVTRAAFDKAS